MQISTPRLTLLPATPGLLQSAIAGDAELETVLGSKVAAEWTIFGAPALEYAHQQLLSAEQENWWTYFTIHVKDNMLIGTCGFKGKPAHGTVEIGYEIAPGYQNQGYGSEVARGLVGHALSHADVENVIAHTLGVDNASTAILRRCGFAKTQEIIDPDDGPIWRWDYAPEHNR